MRAHMAAVRGALAKAKRVVIVGGGPVGVELAGEVRTAFAGTAVTIVHSGPALCHEQQGRATPAAMHARLAAGAAARDIAVKLGVKANLAPLADQLADSGFAAGAATLSLSDGSTIDADLVLQAVGMGASAAAGIQGLPVDKMGRVIVNEFLQVDGLANVFAIGDCAATGDLNMAGAAGSKQNMPFGLPYGHADLVQENIGRLEKAAQAQLKPLVPSAGPSMLVPLGAGEGDGVGFPGFLRGMFLGKKGADYFLGAHRAQARAPPVKPKK
jgi:hypothetical protein